MRSIPTSLFIIGVIAVILIGAYTPELIGDAGWSHVQPPKPSVSDNTDVESTIQLVIEEPDPVGENNAS